MWQRTWNSCGNGVGEGVLSRDRGLVGADWLELQGPSRDEVTHFLALHWHLVIQSPSSPGWYQLVLYSPGQWGEGSRVLTWLDVVIIFALSSAQDSRKPLLTDYLLCGMQRMHAASAGQCS